VAISFGSGFASTFIHIAISSTDFAKIPGVSKELEGERMPVRESNPILGRRPYTALKAAGQVTEPVVSDPKATGENPADTATAEPDEEPQGS